MATIAEDDSYGSGGTGPKLERPMGDGILKEEDLHELYRGYICLFFCGFGDNFYFYFSCTSIVGEV